MYIAHFQHLTFFIGDLSGKKSLLSFGALLKESCSRLFFYKSFLFYKPNQLSSSSVHSVCSPAALCSFSGLPLIFCVCTIASFKNTSTQVFAAAQTVKTRLVNIRGLWNGAHLLHWDFIHGLFWGVSARLGLR